MPGVTAMEPACAKTELVPKWRIDVSDYVAAADISRDGTMCVLGVGNGQVVGVDLATGQQRFALHAHGGGVLGTSISPDCERFVTCGQEPSARIWSRSGELLRELPGGGASWVEHAAWAPAGRRVATAAGKKVRVWTEDGEPLVETEPLESTVSALAWRADGSGLAAACYGGVYILPFVSGAKARQLAWKGSLISLAWSPDAKIIACGSQDSSVHFWRLASGRDSQMSGYRSKPKALAFDRESKLLATAGDATVTVWDFRGKGPEGTRPIQLQSHRGVCTRLAFSPRKGVLASGSQDTSVLLWEPRRSTKPSRFAFLEDEITALQWHPADGGVLAADASGNAAYWETSG